MKANTKENSCSKRAKLCCKPTIHLNNRLKQRQLLAVSFISHIPSFAPFFVSNYVLWDLLFFPHNKETKNAKSRRSDISDFCSCNSEPMQ
jgi:hypothetical protein